MKKIFTISISFILIVFLVSCNGKKAKKYDSLVFDFANDGILTKNDVDYWTEGYFEEKDIPKKTVEFNGIQYTGQYHTSIISTGEPYATHYFYTDDRIRFGIRGDTEQLVSFTVMNNEYFNTEPYLDDVKNAYEVAYDIANNIAKQHLDDIDSYTLIEKESDVEEKERDGKIYTITYYRFKYVKIISGFETSDYISVSVNSKGHLAAVNMGNIGAFDNIEISFEESKVNESVIQKAKEIYKNTGYTLLSNEIVYQKIAITPDGKVCIVSDLEVSLQDTSKQIYGTKVRILTILQTE